MDNNWHTILTEYKGIDNSQHSIKYVLPFNQYSSTYSFNHTEIIVSSSDCLKTAISQKKYGKVLLLNMANESQPGGYPWLKGGQEESLFRTTDLVTRLPRKFYPIKSNELIISKNVKVRGNTNTIDIVSSAAPKMPSNFMGKWMSSGNTGKMYNKIKHLFIVANENQYDILILGAWGCGGYNCPPEHVSQLFKIILKEFQGCFKKIIFAIKDTENHPFSNFNVFQKTLINI